MYEKSKDLILLSFFGFIYYAIVVGMNGHMTKVPLGEYFILPFAISCFMGMAIHQTSQMIEWPLCFLFGGIMGTLSLMTVLSFLGMSFTVKTIAITLSGTFAWFGVVSLLILIGILFGAFCKATFNLVLGSLLLSQQ